jgi:hypothetical protein
VSLVANDFYLICFEEQTGRSRISDAVAALGLSGGLLAELVLGGHLIVRDAALYAAAGIPPPGDRLLWEILHVVCRQQPGQPVETWLRFLATDAVTDVRNRMCAAGLLARVRTRRLAGGRDRYRYRYLPTDSNAAAWPGIRLAKVLCAYESVPQPDAVLAGLVKATGLLKHVLWGPEHAGGFACATRLRGALPAPLAAVVAHTEAAVGQHVLTRRNM